MVGPVGDAGPMVGPAFTLRYIARLGYPPTFWSVENVLQPRTRYVASHKQTEADIERNVSYGTASADFKAILTKLGYDAENYGEHSARRGGACTSYRGGASMAAIKARGQWKTDSMAEHYVQTRIDDYIVNDFLDLDK